MSNGKHFLAFDLGASSGRAVLGRWDGRRFTLHELHRFDNGPVDILGHLHWDALRLWCDIKDGLAAYTRTSTQPLAGVGIDTWGVDYALLDRAGHLIGNPYNYRDSRTDGMLEWVCARVPRERIFDVTGIQFLAINTLYQLAAMVAGRDPQLEIADTLLLMPDLLHYWLTGQRGVEYTNASTTQMLDCRSRGWATALLDELGLPTGLLPDLIQPGAVLGTVREAVCRETGLQGGTPVIVPATHDTASAVAAIPGLDAHSAYISSGTWSLMGVETGHPVVNQRALELNITNEGGIGGTIRLLKNINGLWLLQESRRQWQREGRHLTWEHMLAEAEAAMPLVSLVDPDAPPFMQPGDLPGAMRAFCANAGQPVPGSIGAIVRCCLESLALKYRMVLQALEDLSGQRIDTVRVVGGGSQNALLCQLTADACGRAVVAGPVEATALGNLLMQAIAAGELPDIATGRQVLADTLELQHYEPRATAAWDEAAERFRNLLAP